jgi:prephenate dehydrogenase
LNKKDIDNCIFVSVPINVTRTIAQELHDVLAENFPENKIVIVSENINFLRLELIK